MRVRDAARGGLLEGGRGSSRSFSVRLSRPVSLTRGSQPVDHPGSMLDQAPGSRAPMCQGPRRPSGRHSPVTGRTAVVLGCTLLACAPGLPRAATGPSAPARTAAPTPTPARTPATPPPSGPPSAVAVAPVAVPAVAAPPLAAPARSVDDILADAVQALGGAVSLARHTSSRTRMEITFRGLGMSGTVEHVAAVGDRVLTITTLAGLASSREGCDGRRCWAEDPINGLRVLSGPEAEQSLIEAAWNGELRWRALFPRIEARNERDEGGALLECLIMTPAQGGTWTNCYDRATHLLTVQRLVHAGPQGDVPFTSRVSDWRRVEDMLVPYALEMQAGPLAFTGRVTSVELDRPVDARAFQVPTRPTLSPAPAGK